MKTVDYVVSGYIFKEDKVLLVYHKKLKKWLPPGGHIKKNENPIEALVREVYEETNFQISVCHNFCSFKKGDVLILPSPHHIQWEKIDKEHFHVDLVYLCQIEKEGSLKKGVKFINLNDLKNKKDIPKDVIYFAHYFYKIHLNKTGINDIKLPIMSYLVEKEKSSYFSSIKLFVIQHIKKNTIKFIDLLKKAGFKEIYVVGKNYSFDKEAYKKIKKIAKVLLPSFEKLESLESIKELFNKYLRDDEKFICLDLGGYFSRYFQFFEKKDNRLKNLLGVIEDTKNGIWLNSNQKIKIKFPWFSVASSCLKDYGENYFVAKSIFRNLENILINSNLNDSLFNKKILILGYGKIGRRLGEFLRKENFVFFYDVNPIRLLEAKIDGFDICQNLDNLDNFEIIIGVTGNVVLNEDFLIKLKNKVILVNGSTRKREFDFFSLKDKVKKVIALEEYEKYILKNGKIIYLINKGYPVNFYKSESLPDKIIDLVFSEIYLLTKIIAEKKFHPGFYPIEEKFIELEKRVTKVWLDFWENKTNFL